MNVTHARLLASVGLTALVSWAYAAPARAQAVAPPLGTADSYAVLGTNGIPTTGTVTCTTSTIDGNVGSTGNSITDTGPCTITGGVDAPVAAGVVSDFDNAYNSVAALNPLCDGVVPIATTTLPPGVYCSDAGTTIGAGVTITLDGNASDVWVFRIGTGGLGALTGTGPNLEVVMGGTADACNVYWWTAEAASMTNAVFAGTVLSGTAATMTGTSWEGRALATTDVALTDSIITGCAPAVPPVAELAITKTDSADPVSPGDTFTYTVLVENLGPDPAENVVISDTLPAELTFQSATPSAGGLCATPAVGSAGGTVTCTFAGDTAVGEMRSVDIVVGVPAAATPGTVVNPASAIADNAPLVETSEPTLIVGPVPTLGEAGAVLLGLLLAAAGLLALRRRPQPTGWSSW
jgi:uncharacterized repeat protein (TIGR01451 family)